MSIWRRHMARSQWRRGSVAIDATLLLPVVILLFGAVGQAMTFAKHRNLAEQAAYAAARSALSEFCPTPTSVLGVLNPTNNCTPNAQAWENAARWALVPAGTASGRGGFGDQCAAARHGGQLFLAGGMASGLSTALRNKICYVFAPGNSEITITRLTALPVPSRPNYIAVRATVRFKFPISAPIGLFLSDGQHADGTPWAWGEATMVLS